MRFQIVVLQNVPVQKFLRCVSRFAVYSTHFLPLDNDGPRCTAGANKAADEGLMDLLKEKQILMVALFL